MKILVISDTHGSCRNLNRVLERTGDADILIHCGDVEDDEALICQMAGCPAYMVSGNNDHFTDLPEERLLEIGGKRIFIAHGHTYGVFLNTQRIYEEGVARDADLVFFGHTHRPMIKQKGKILLFNPGSLSYPRQEGRRPTYGVVTIDNKGGIDAAIYELRR